MDKPSAFRSPDTMGSSTLITDYLGQGTHAARPAAASVAALIPAGGTAFYVETDTEDTFALIAGAWVQVNGGGGGGGGPTTMGFEQPSAFTNFGGGNYCTAAVYATDNITITSVATICGVAQAGANITPYIYADNAGMNTGALLGDGPQVANVTVGINKFPLTSGLNMVSGTLYWIGLLISGSGINIAQSALGNSGYAGASGSAPAASGPGSGRGASYLVWGQA